MTLRLIETHSTLQLNQAGIMMLMLIFYYELDKIHLSLMQTCAYKQSQTSRLALPLTGIIYQSSMQAISHDERCDVIVFADLTNC